MKKKEGIDFMKYWPVLVAVVGLISGYTLLGARISGAEDRLDKSEAWLGKNVQDTNQIQIAQARMEARQESIYEILKDIKESVKK